MTLWSMVVQWLMRYEEGWISPHYALCFIGIKVHLRNFLMHQVLMAIDVSGTLRFHLGVRGFRGCAGRPGILVAVPAGDAVPIYE